MVWTNICSTSPLAFPSPASPDSTLSYCCCSITQLKNGIHSSIKRSRGYTDACLLLKIASLLSSSEVTPCACYTKSTASMEPARSQVVPNFPSSVPQGEGALLRECKPWNWKPRPSFHPFAGLCRQWGTLYVSPVGAAGEDLGPYHTFALDSLSIGYGGGEILLAWRQHRAVAAGDLRRDWRSAGE